MAVVRHRVNTFLRRLALLRRVFGRLHSRRIVRFRSSEDALRLARRISESIEEGKAGVVRRLLRMRHPADIALVLSLVEDEEVRERVFKLLSLPVQAAVLKDLPAELAREMMRALDAERLSAILTLLPPEESADLLAHLSPDDQVTVLYLLDPSVRDVVQKLLHYPPESAGGRMSPSVLSVRDSFSVGQVLEVLRHSVEEYDSENIYVVDALGRLVGVVDLKSLIRAEPDRPVREIMSSPVVTFTPLQDQEEVAMMFQKYDLHEAPVVDSKGRLLGVIRADDILDVLQEEYSEDIMRTVGSHPLELETRKPLQVALLRLPWLFITVGIEMVVGVVIHLFDETLGKVILLASFIPVTQAMSGNTGLQSAAVVLRGLVTGSVVVKEWWRAVWRQLQVTLVMGSVLGLLVFVVGGFWYGMERGVGFHPVFGLVVGVSMFLAVNVSGMVGTVVPLLSYRLGFDPAITMGPFETALQDLISVTIMLSLATVLLHSLL